MKKVLTLLLTGVLIFSLAGCHGRSGQKTKTESRVKNSTSAQEKRKNKKLRIRLQSRNGQSILFRLNDSPAAQSLYDQLPLSIQIEDYKDSEKIFYPPKELDTSSTPLAEGPPGTLAYYEPWGDVAVFYEECQVASGLYEIGEAVSGKDQLKNLKGKVTVEAVTENAENS